MGLWTRFKADQRGATAVLFGLTVVPLVGLAGAAVDYSRASAARAALQTAADKTALNMVIARHNGRRLDFKALFKDALKDSAAASAVDEVVGQWLTADKEFRVTVSAQLDTTLFKVFQPKMAIGVAATALGQQELNKVTIEGANLSPEAADYNELSAYCYNGVTKTRLGPIDPETGKRTDFVKISDNSDAGVKAKPKNLDVTCGASENVSYLLKNVRWARNDPALQRTGETWRHYTDTTMETHGPNAGVPRYNTLHKDLIETIVCETKDKCRPKSQGGILPNNHETGRTPQVNAKACKPGQYLYLGWEDRPPGAGDSDRDYDDIRFTMRCPGTTAGPFSVRLTA